MVLTFNENNWTQEQIIHQFFEWYDYDQHYGGVKDNLKSLRHYIHPISFPESIPELDNLSQKELIGLFLNWWDFSFDEKKNEREIQNLRRKIQIDTPTGVASYKTCNTCSEEISSKQIFCKKCENDFLWKED